MTSTTAMPKPRRVIAGLEQRLREPLRLAIAGMVKAGKSTLLNAMLGEQIAPTDTAECTRVVTWYRYSATPTITMHPREGEPRRMPVRRERGRLAIDLGGMPAEDVEWIDVGWPLGALKSMILIDTPGIASLSEDTSARARRFLTPEESPSAADAVVYLMRHLHGSDVRFLEAFRDTAAGAAQTVCAVGVLSRSDEIGSGRIDSLLSAGKVARRYERDGDLASLVLGVIPVAGLVAEGARTLREDEYLAFRHLAELERSDRERLLVSADRFTRDSDATTLSTERAARAAGAVRHLRAAPGHRAHPRRRHELVRALGVDGAAERADRAAAVRARSVPHPLVDAQGARGAAPAREARSGTGRATAPTRSAPASSGSRRARMRCASCPCSPRPEARGFRWTDADAADAQLILGGKGTSAHLRLGLREHADDETLRRRVDDKLAYWRGLAESPLTDRAAAGVCRVVIRSLDQIASDVAVTPSEVAAADDAVVPAPDVVLTSGPGDGLREDGGEQGEQDETGLRRKKKLKRFAAIADRHPFH